MELTCVNENDSQHTQTQVRNMICYAENKAFEKVRYSFDITNSISDGGASSNNYTHYIKLFSKNSGQAKGEICLNPCYARLLPLEPRDDMNVECAAVDVVEGDL